jgi:hypothetical protein
LIFYRLGNDYVWRDLHWLHWDSSSEAESDGESGTLSSGVSDGWGEHIEEGEGGSGGERDHGELIERHLLSWDKEGGEGNNETLNEVLHKTNDEFTDIKRAAIFHFIVVIEKVY